MQITDRIAEIETRAKRRDVSIAAILREADVSIANWSFWKRGKHMPQMRIWLKVEQAVAKLLGDADDSDASMAAE